MKTIAILLDGGFVTKKLYNLLNRHATAEDILDFSNACIRPDEELFRTYYYDCPPFEETQTNPATMQQINFGTTSQCTRGKQLQSQLALSDHIAFRRGKLLFKGWVIKRNSLRQILTTHRPIRPTDYEPDLEQKSVDIKIGLDVAWLASKRIVDRIVLVSGDSDLIPAMKFARREGVQVVLVTLGHVIKQELREHTDEFRVVSFPSRPQTS